MILNRSVLVAGVVVTFEVALDLCQILLASWPCHGFGRVRAASTVG